MINAGAVSAGGKATTAEYAPYSEFTLYPVHEIADGGEQEGQWILWSDQVLLTITKYPDQASAIKAQMAIVARGAFELQGQTALSMDEMIEYQAEING